MVGANRKEKAHRATQLHIEQLREKKHRGIKKAWETFWEFGSHESAGKICQLCWYGCCCSCLLLGDDDANKREAVSSLTLQHCMAQTNVPMLAITSACYALLAMLCAC